MLSIWTSKKFGIWKRVNNPEIKMKKEEAFESIVGEEKAGNQHFLLFPQSFLLFQKKKKN